MQSSSTFVWISGPIPKVKKKFALINDFKNFIAHWKESEQSKALMNKFGLFRIELGGPGGGATPGKFCILYPHLSLETVFESISFS